MLAVYGLGGGRFGSLRGFGDAGDASDPCTLNPTDPVCVEFYGGRMQSEQAAIESTATASGEIDFGCGPGYAEDATGACMPITAPAPVGKVAAAPSAAAALPKMSWKTGLLITLGALLAIGSVAAVSHYRRRAATA